MSCDNNCTICLEFVLNDEFINLNCCCEFIHTDCVTQWLQMSDACPCCRNDLDRVQIYGESYNKYMTYRNNIHKEIINKLLKNSNYMNKEENRTNVLNDVLLDEKDKSKFINIINNF